jgi:hypothetical protein
LRERSVVEVQNARNSRALESFEIDCTPRVGVSPCDGWANDLRANLEIAFASAKLAIFARERAEMLREL